MQDKFEPLAFGASKSLSMGVELELQIVNRHDFNLARGAPDLIAALKKTPLAEQIKPEMTEGMIELNSSIHTDFTSLLAELRSIRTEIVKFAKLQNVGIAGGGSHPFHKWHDQTIYPTERFKYISDLYGYLAKQFTVFGQHIHIGCSSGDEALFLTHMMSRYIPHFIALSASSPFFQGHDTAFDSSRLNAVNAFPLSGQMPFVHSWDDFNQYFGKMYGFGIVKSMKDFYWDIRPKPEFGTIEIRVGDTPLSVEKAAILAIYAQALARYHLMERPLKVNEDVYKLYSYNRFQSCRFGLRGNFIDAYTQRHTSLRDDILRTLTKIMPHAEALGSAEALHKLITTDRNDALWLRETLGKVGSLHDVVRLQCDVWAGVLDANIA